MTVTFHPAAPLEDPTFTYVKRRSSLKLGGVGGWGGGRGGLYTQGFGPEWEATNGGSG